MKWTQEEIARCQARWRSREYTSREIAAMLTVALNREVSFSAVIARMNRSSCPFEGPQSNNVPTVRVDHSRIGAPTVPRKPPPEVDTSNLDDTQRRSRECVIRMGELAFGDGWKTPLAETLTRHLGRKVSAQQVSHWVNAQRPVPAVLIPRLAALAQDLAVGMEHRAADLRTVWTDQEGE